MNIVTVAIACIDVGHRLRAVDEDYARLIATSMAADGQRTPIEVRAADPAGMHRLIAGGHRVRAAQIAGLAELQAVVLAVGELDAQRLEIEENLCRHELTELDRSTFLARWKEVYEGLNEAVRHGGARRRGQVAKSGELTAHSITRFAKFRLNNTTTPLFAAAVADAAGATAATLTVTFAGGPLTNGLAFTLSIGGTPVNVAVPAGATAAACAQALVLMVLSMPDLPVAPSAVVNASTTLVAKNGGACGNEIDVRLTYRSDAASPQIFITVGAVAEAPRATLSGGVGNPDISPLIAAMAGSWFTDIVAPWTDATNRGELAAELVRRYGAMVNLDARGYVGAVGSYGTVVGYGDAGNCIQMIQVGVRGQLEPGWEWAAAWAGVHSFRLANDPSRQSRGIAVAGITAPAPADQWLPQERDLLLNNGVSTWTALADGTVVVGRTITGYLTSNLGVADAAWLDVMTPATATRIRYDWDNYVELVYPQAKLFDDDSIGAEYDNTAATPKRLKGSWGKRCLDYERAGWIENSSDTAQASTFQRNPNDKNRADCDLNVRIAGNLIILANVLEFQA